MSRLTLTDAEEMISAAFPEPPARSIPVSLAPSNAPGCLRTPGEIRRAFEPTEAEAEARERAEAWGRDLDRQATLALCGTALAWTGSLWAAGWLVTRLPGGWRDLAAVGAVFGVAWVVRRSLD